MTELSRHPPDPGCPSDLVLDRWVAGDRGDAGTGNHLATCARCSARVAAFEEAQVAASPAVTRAIAHARENASRPRWIRWAWGGGLAAAASATILLVMLIGPEPESGGVRAKGSAMRFVVQRDGRVFAGTSGDLFRGGDALRFLVSTGSACHFILVGIEQGGRVSAYYPYDGDASVEIQPGADLPLPGSLVLDDASGTEFFLGIFAPKPVTLAEIEAAVAAASGGETLSLSVLKDMPLPGSHHWVVVRKE